MRIGVTHYVKLDKVFENILSVSNGCLVKNLIEGELIDHMDCFHKYLSEGDPEKALLQIERIRSDIIDIDAFLENFKVIITEYGKILTQVSEEEEDDCQITEEEIDGDSS